MPTRDAYTAAMQNPAERFRDPELANGRTVRKASGQPIVYSGQFASVYRMSGKGRDHAVRCFVSEAPNRQQRYRALSDYLNIMRPPGFVSFTYLDRELLIRGERHPVLKMDWVEGQTLDRYIDANLANPGALRALAAEWLRLMKDLQSMPMAHNDLQHGNVIVKPTGDLRLVDYDGVFLAPFKGQRSPELGHRNYQHPSRTAQDYHEHIDNFPALVIHLSLMAITRDPSLWNRFHDGDNLLFTRKDLANPSSTPLWSALTSSPDSQVRRLTAELERCCRLPVSQVPALEVILTGKTTAGSTSPQNGGPTRLVLKTHATRHRRSPGPASAPSRPAQPYRQPHVSTSNAAAGISALRTGAASTNSAAVQTRTRSGQLADFARKAMTATACTIVVTRKAVRGAMVAWRDIDLAARRHGDRFVTALYLLAMLALPAFGVFAIYYLTGNATVTLVTFLVGAGAAATLYAFCLDGY